MYGNNRPNAMTPTHRQSDVAAISFFMAVFGEPAGWLLLLYIWVTLGSGFRFGARYLISELAMSVVGNHVSRARRDQS